jgi:uncharacterized protein YlxP (DUF503 family)
MTIALLSVELFLPMSQSLKDKRMVLRRLKDRLGAFNVSVAEVAHQDLWQRAGLSIAAVATSDDMAERTVVGPAGNRAGRAGTRDADSGGVRSRARAQGRR